jgi:peptide chain release factor subunit 1
MITMIIPPGDDINRHVQKLVTEEGTANVIKSRVNRLSVLAAIGSAKYKLKQ